MYQLNSILFSYYLDYMYVHVNRLKCVASSFLTILEHVRRYSTNY